MAQGLLQKEAGEEGEEEEKGERGERCWRRGDQGEGEGVLCHDGNPQAQVKKRQLNCLLTKGPMPIPCLVLYKSRNPEYLFSLFNAKKRKY